MTRFAAALAAIGPAAASIFLVLTVGALATVSVVNAVELRAARVALAHVATPPADGCVSLPDDILRQIETGRAPSP